jgi:hypothetical protein
MTFSVATYGNILLIVLVARKAGTGYWLIKKYSANFSHWESLFRFVTEPPKAIKRSLS